MGQAAILGILAAPNPPCPRPIQLSRPGIGPAQPVIPKVFQRCRKPTVAEEITGISLIVR